MEEKSTRCAGEGEASDALAKNAIEHVTNTKTVMLMPITVPDRVAPSGVVTPGGAAVSTSGVAPSGAAASRIPQRLLSKSYGLSPRKSRLA